MWCQHPYHLLVTTTNPNYYILSGKRGRKWRFLRLCVMCCVLISTRPSNPWPLSVRQILVRGKLALPPAAASCCHTTIINECYRHAARFSDRCSRTPGGRTQHRAKISPLSSGQSSATVQVGKATAFMLRPRTRLAKLKGKEKRTWMLNILKCINDCKALQTCSILQVMRNTLSLDSVVQSLKIESWGNLEFAN